MNLTEWVRRYQELVEYREVWKERVNAFNEGVETYTDSNGDECYFFYEDYDEAMADVNEELAGLADAAYELLTNNA